MTFRYQITGDPNGLSTVTAFNPDSAQGIYVADSNHPNYEVIVEGLTSGDVDAFEYFDPAKTAAVKMTRLSSRVTYEEGNILFDGEVQTGPIANHLMRCMREGTKDYAPIVAFWEKVAENPSMRSREQLFKWLSSHKFSIADDGDIIGYKGLGRGRHSVHSGEAMVNGVTVKGTIPNEDGSVITMDRSQVQDDPAIACHKGLHVGDWSYASSFGGGTTVEVRVNPRDVVSIPSDSNERKMRCCRYKVEKQVSAPYDKPIVANVAKPAVNRVGYSGF